MDGGSVVNNMEPGMMMGGGVEVNDLLSTHKCSPFVVYGIIALISLFSLYSSKNTLNKYNGKFDGLMGNFMMHEVKILIIMGAAIYGLCVFKEKQLAWVFILVLIIYKLIKNIIIYMPLPGAVSTAPNNFVMSGSANYGLTPQMQQALLQQSAKQNINKHEWNINKHE